MNFKQQSTTTIEYILIGNGSPLIATFLPPSDIKFEVISFIRQCPTDLIQLYDSLEYHTAYLKNNITTGYNFHILKAKDYKQMKGVVRANNHVQLFFLDGNKDRHLEIYESLQTNNSFRYFYFYNKKPNLTNGRIVNNPFDFIKILISEYKSILKHLNINHNGIAPSVFTDFKDHNTAYYFSPTKNNYYLIERIIGNFGSKITGDIEKKLNKKSTEALENPHAFQRQNQFIDQINKIDNFHLFLYREKVIVPISTSHPLLSPLILISPFNNPDLKKFTDNHPLINAYLIEQNENYTHSFIPNNRTPTPFDEEGKFALQLQIERVNYLDNIGLLHSSFSHSPVIRLPIKGKSIYRELSFFKPDFFNRIGNTRNRQALKKSIYNFGKRLKTATISDELKNLIKKRNGQIVAISDQPIEWLLLDEIPLAFSHDVCRLPETTMHGLMSFYAINQKFEYSIPKDIMSKTLVILGTDEIDFQKWHPLIYELSEKLGFNIAKCNSITKLKSTLNKFKPEFLIFDTHGDIDSSTQSSYLYIGDEKLTGEHIIKNNIYAPIIFLSACGTAPTYGTFHPIANAFIEAGSMTVTSTYAPVGIDSASLLYYRILYKLDSANRKGIHKNWLEFVCHVARTSSINDAYSHIYKKKNYDNINYVMDNHTEDLVTSLHFNERRKLYFDLDKKLSKLTKSERLHFSLVIPEYLLYTHIGRADLILFDSWKEQYDKVNNIDSTGS